MREKNDISRRDFIKKGTVGTAGMIGSISIDARTSNSGPPSPKEAPELSKGQKFKRICISTWAFNRWIRPGEGQGEPRITLLDFPRFIDYCYGVKNLELCNAHFDSMELGYLDKLIKSMFDAESKVRNIAVSTRIDLANPEREARLESVETAKKWVDLARYIGSPSVRFDVGGKAEGTLEEKINAAIDSYTRLSDYGAEKNVKILIENHAGGIATDYRNLLRVFAGVNSPFLEPLNDLGNFPNAEDQRSGIRDFCAISGWICHVKPPRFIELEECFEILRECGFHGYCSIESPLEIRETELRKEGIGKMLDRVLKCL